MSRGVEALANTPRASSSSSSPLLFFFYAALTEAKRAGALVSTERHATLGTIPRRQYPPPLPLPPPLYRRADVHIVESRSDEAMPRSLPQEDHTTSRYEIKAARVTAEATKRRLARDAVRTMEPLSFFASNATTSAF